MGLPPPDPCSLCPLSSTEFVEPPRKKIPGYATDLTTVQSSIAVRASRSVINSSVSKLWFDMLQLALICFKEVTRGDGSVFDSVSPLRRDTFVALLVAGTWHERCSRESS
jgi:hypothetical protein